MKLFFNALIKFICGLLIVSALIFIPAGTFSYPYGWRFICVVFIPIFILGIILFIKSPQLLEKRLESKEKEKTQKSVVAFSALVFLFGFILAGLDFRFNWTVMPKTVSLIASIIFILAYGLYAEVTRENEYLSRTIKVEENQQVVDSGLYSIVRHPMYMTTIILFLMIPLILGSLVSFIIFLIYPIIIAFRISNEEKILTEQLKGYSEYKKKVKYRLIPFVW